MTSEAAGIGRRFVALLYECLVLLGIAFFAAFAFQGATSDPLAGSVRYLFQAYLFLVIGLYFIWCWVRGGQTLPMKTWRLRLVNARGGRISARQALARYVLAWISLLAAGAGFLWAFIDSDRQFLHDRLAGTRIVVVQAGSPRADRGCPSESGVSDHENPE